MNMEYSFMDSEEKKIVPKCKGGSQAYYSASGRWLPCCSFPDHGEVLENSIFNKDEFLIKNSADLQFHDLDIFQLWLDRIEEDYDSAYVVCKKRCSKKAHVVGKEIKEMNWVMEEIHTIKKPHELYEFLEKHDIEYEWE